MRVIPARVQTKNCTLDYDIPIAGSLLGLTVPEFEKVVNTYYDMSARMTVVLSALLQYPQLIDVLYPPIHALSEICEDEMTKLDEEQAKVLRKKLESIQRFVSNDPED